MLRQGLQRLLARSGIITESLPEQRKTILATLVSLSMAGSSAFSRFRERDKQRVVQVPYEVIAATVLRLLEAIRVLVRKSLKLLGENSMRRWEKCKHRQCGKLRLCEGHHVSC